MLHCNISVQTARLNSAAPSTTTAPGIFTAKTLQSVLSVPLLTSRQQQLDADKLVDEFVSPYGRLPRATRKTRCPRHRNDCVEPRCNESQVVYAAVIKRKRCRKLEPVTVRGPSIQIEPKLNDPQHGNQASSIDRASLKHVYPAEQRLQQLRFGLKQTSAEQLKNADRLKSEIQWIHGHFPVLKLANSKCSRTLRQQLFRNAIVHVFVNAMLRKAWRFWHDKVVDAQRKERLQLRASRRLIAMFERASLDRINLKFDRWREWVTECQAQEYLAATITLQKFARFLRSRREGKEYAAQQVALLQTLQQMSRQAEKIQNMYRRHRQTIEQHRREDDAQRIQRIELRRIANLGFSKRQNAATVIQRNYQAYSRRCNRKRAAAITRLFDRSRKHQARRIQSAWLAYKSWRDCILPVELVESLVDQVEFLFAVLSIQRHLRGFQCRFRLKRKNNSAVRIQNCWRGTRRLEAARLERQMAILQRSLAASCIQRTFRRKKEDRKIRVMMRRSTRPLYLRARYLGDSFRERYRVQISKSAIVVIQTAWRRHVAYEKEKLRRLLAATMLQRFLRRGAILSRWHSTVGEAPLQHHRRRDAAARILQRWIRGRYSCCKNSAIAVYVVEQIYAALVIQRWYRRWYCDQWRFILARLLAHELPRCINAVNRLARCWRTYSTRKKEHVWRASTLADLIKQQCRQQVEDRAVRFIQRMLKRAIDRRDGKLLLQRYKILLREDLKRRQQRVVVHKFLQEKIQQRKVKQEAHAVVAGARRGSTKSVISSLQSVSIVSETIESAASSPYEDSQQSSDAQAPEQYWSEEYQRAYLYDPATGESTWL